MILKMKACQEKDFIISQVKFELLMLAVVSILLLWPEPPIYSKFHTGVDRKEFGSIILIRRCMTLLSFPIFTKMNKIPLFPACGFM